MDIPLALHEIMSRIRQWWEARLGLTELRLENARLHRAVHDYARRRELLEANNRHVAQAAVQAKRELLELRKTLHLDRLN